MTFKDAEIIGHSLGINLFHAQSSNKKRDRVLPKEFYRNRFCTSDGHGDLPTIESLLESGYIAKAFEKGPMTYWFVTEQGQASFREYFEHFIADCPRLIIPRVGDVWDFYPTFGKKHTTRKQIAAIYWKFSPSAGKYVPFIQWSHTPKARYLNDTRVKFFLQKKAIRLVSRK